MNNNEALALLREIVNKATLEEGEVDKTLLYDTVFEYIDRFEEEA